MSLSIDASRRKLLLTVLPAQGPPGELIYEGGYFYGPGSDTRFYFLTYGGKDLLVASTMGLVVYDAVMFQKLEPAEPPLAVEVPMNDETWLIRNAPPWMEMFESAKPMATSRIYEELPGYVNLEGVRRVVRPDFAAIAATALRDQNDLALFSVEGKAWMRTANVLRSRARDVAQIAPGTDHRDDRPRRLQRMARRRTGCGASLSHTRSRPRRHRGGRHGTSRQPRRR